MPCPGATFLHDPFFALKDVPPLGRILFIGRGQRGHDQCFVSELRGSHEEPAEPKQ